MKKYILLAIAILLIYFCQSFFNATGGIGADSLSYFGIASDLPRLETNLFPLGFPVLLKGFHFIFQDYFWAAKVLIISMVATILAFSYLKKFYFRETVLLFTGKTLFFAMNWVVSESLFVFLLYFLIYIFHEKWQEKISSKKFILFGSLLLVSLFTVRYSGIYIFAGFGIFYLIKIWRNKSTRLYKDFLKVLIISGLGILAYLFFNYFTYGSFTGENLRGAPQQFHAVYIFRDILGVTNVVDPFIGIKPSSNSLISLSIQLAIMLLDLMLVLYFIKLVKKKRNLILMDFHVLLWVIAGVYTLALFTSGYFQQIEEMNARMLAAANFLLFFSFLIIYFTDLKSDLFIFRLACFFFLFLTAYSLKMPQNYFKNRREIENQMPKLSDKKFLFNDEKEAPNSLTEYHIPILNKTFQYQHTNNQQGDIKQIIAGTVDPQIKWLKYDTIKDKSQVLYSSDLKLK